MGNQKQIRKRHCILDHCLRDTMHEYTLDDLLRTVNRSLAELGQRPVSERQLYNDISYFQSEEGYGAKLETYRIVRNDEKGRNRSYVAYRYPDPNYSIQQLQLPELQLRFFRAIIQGMLNFNGTPLQDWLTSHYDKLMEYNDGLIQDNCVMMDINPYIGGVKAKEWVQTFEKAFMAIIDHHSLNIKVDTTVFGQVVGVFHPVFMRQYNRRWYMLGVMEDNRSSIVVLPIDLVQSIEFASVPYYMYPFNPNEYFEDIVGVYNPDTPVMDVHLRFYGWLAKHLEFNPIHGSQRSHWTVVNGEKALEVHLSVKHNLELENLLMSYSGMLEVIGPEELVDVHKKHLINGCKKNGIKVEE